MATIKLYQDKGCTCDWQELPNQIKDSPVKGYAKVGELCQKCKDQQIIDIDNSKAKETEMAKNKLIAEKQRELAIEELKKEGKLDSNGELI